MQEAKERNKPKGVDETAIWKRLLKELHEEMDVQIEKRQHRFELANYTKKHDEAI